MLPAGLDDPLCDEGAAAGWADLWWLEDRSWMLAGDTDLDSTYRPWRGRLCRWAIRLHLSVTGWAWGAGTAFSAKQARCPECFA